MTRQGSVIVVSAPSGAGKRTVLNRVFVNNETLQYALSATTRVPRDGEIDGKDYIFLDREEFHRRIDVGDFVEWAEVHGNLYGTLRAELERQLNTGNHVVLEIDIQGMRNIKNTLDKDVVTVFVMPPSLEELERRIRARGANDEDDITLRLENAEAEIDARDEFDYIVVNDDLAQAVLDFEEILKTQCFG